MVARILVSSQSRRVVLSLFCFCLLSEQVVSFNSTINRNYFNFPPLTDWIPAFKVGDAVNVSWATDWDSRNINVWCGKQFFLIQSFSNLPAKGYQLLPVLDSWLDPCHLQFFSVNASTGKEIQDFNSGAFNVDTVKAATPTTWAADDANSACPTFYTGGGMLPSATNAVAVNSSAARESGSASGGLSGACAAGSGSKSSSPSFGAGIGVGIAIAGGIAAGTALIWWLLHRRKTSTTPAELGGSRVQYPNGYGEKSQPTFKGYQGPVELHNESRSELPP